MAVPGTGQGSWTLCLSPAVSGADPSGLRVDHDVAELGALAADLLLDGARTCVRLGERRLGGQRDVHVRDETLAGLDEADVARAGSGRLADDPVDGRAGR